MDRRTFLKSIAAGAVMGSMSFGGCVSSEINAQKDLPRLILCYLPCTVSCQHLSPYNSSVTYTPNLEAFASDAAVLANHVAEAGQTGICFGSTLSGNQAPKHGVFQHPREIHQNVVLLSQLIDQTKYEVHFWTNHPMASHQLGYSRGTPETNKHESMFTADDPAFQTIMRRIAEEPDYYAFVFVLFSITHGPYYQYGLDAMSDDFIRQQGMPPNEAKYFVNKWIDHNKNEINRFKIRYNFDYEIRKLGINPDDRTVFIKTVDILYAATINNLDHEFGRVIEQSKSAGIYDKSLIVFSADHGETITRENALFRFSHGFQLCPHSRRIPFIIRGPAVGIAPGQYPQVSRSVDFLPTMLSFAGISGLEVSGVDLSPALKQQKDFPQLTAFAHTGIPHVESIREKHPECEFFLSLFPSEAPEHIWHMMQEGALVYKWAVDSSGGSEPERAVFNIENDPLESINLYDMNNSRFEEKFQTLGRYRQSMISSYHIWEKIHSGADVSIEQLDALRELGYL